MSTVVFAALSVLDAELNQIKNSCTKVAILSSFSTTDSAATITSNTIASLSLVGSAPTAAQFVAGDFVISGTSSRTMTFLSGSPTGKSSVADGAAVPTTGTNANGTQIAFLDTGGNPLWVTTMVSQNITNGNTVNFPSITYTSNQPSAA